VPARADKGNPHPRLDQELVAAQNALLQRDRGALDLLVAGDDVEHIVHARGFQELGLNIPDKLFALADEVIE
jgi:hypothetical protein